MVRAEYEALSAAGHEVHQHIEHNPSGAVRAALALGASTWNVAAAQRVRAQIATVRPDVAHVHNTWFASSPSIFSMLRKQRIPVVMTVHNYRVACVNSLLLRQGAPCESCVGRTPWAAVRHACYRDNRALSAVAAFGIAAHQQLGTWTKYVDRYIVLSEFAGERLERAGLPRDRLVAGSNFVADPGPRLQPPSRSRTVLFVGRISAEKGLSVLLRAWSHHDPADLRLDVIGDGPERERLESAAPPGVRFLGALPRHEVMTRLGQARVLVIPSIWYEGQPVTALESLASGTPLLLSDIGGLPEILGGTNAGWTSAPHDAVALSDLIQTLDDDAVDARGAAARQRYLDAFTSDKAVARLTDVYDAAVDAAP